MKRIFSLSIATKVYLLIGFFLAVMWGMSMVTINSVEDNSYKLREAHVRDVVSSTVSQLEALQQLVDEGILSLEEAKKQGSFLLGSVRYEGDSGYIFASDYQGRIQAHPRPDLMGSNQWNLQDPNGQYIYRDLIDVAKQGGGSYYYIWELENDDGIMVDSPKLSYALPFEPWGWMVGTGTFVNDIEAMTGEMRAEIRNMIILAMVVTTLLGTLVAFSVSRPVNRLRDRMQGLGKGEFDEPVPYTDGHNEVAHMAQSIEVFREALAQKAEIEAREEAVRAERAADAKMQQDVVNDLAAGLNHLASGNLDARIEHQYAGAYEVLRKDYNKTVDALRGLIGDIVTVSQEIDARSRGIHSSAQRVAQSSEVTTSTLEQTAAALEDLTATVSRAADSAEEVNGIVEGAASSAASSGDVVDQAVSAMNAIETSSTSIANITNVIDDIAFQTNLLALNAGVEAARAGESGQGFAVVASEVRALAGRASEAASEIKNLIKASGEEVGRGSRLVDDAGEALGGIAKSVGQITEHVANITSGTREQYLSLSEINEAIAELDRSTQQNTAMFQGTLGDSEVLTQKARELATRVQHFKIGDAKSTKRPGFNSRRAA
ncbi:methyl-accepting chemotaxis protein [Shimia isoporae]|uniref:Methyl-accepting chemotaxis protein n=1 Tax=Shimia isoporae TaxID=647720 RepID=A0A4V2Q258_9RHOB|nr:methyl-accepting chemotaxis protein [Shimia isoporae]TCL01211.1 methyl-accepting chemotaxis protein [Shimia isoporae]